MKYRVHHQNSYFYPQYRPWWCPIWFNYKIKLNGKKYDVRRLYPRGAEEYLEKHPKVN